MAAVSDVGRIRSRREPDEATGKPPKRPGWFTRLLYAIGDWLAAHGAETDQEAPDNPPDP